jgi:hypothetical protein
MWLSTIGDSSHQSRHSAPITVEHPFTRGERIPVAVACLPISNTVPAKERGIIDLVEHSSLPVRRARA